jgi:K+-transporting ATPase ATPase A chain
MQAGGNMEGKEVRFGIADSALFATVTTATSAAVNSMHDRYGSAARCRWSTCCSARSSSACRFRLYGLLLFAIIALFVAGLMVGRTRNISARSSGWAGDDDAAILCLPFSILVYRDRGGGRALAACRTGPHGYTEVLYAYTGTANNAGVR